MAVVRAEERLNTHAPASVAVGMVRARRLGREDIREDDPRWGEVIDW